MVLVVTKIKIFSTVCYVLVSFHLYITYNLNRTVTDQNLKQVKIANWKTKIQSDSAAVKICTNVTLA